MSARATSVDITKFAATPRSGKSSYGILDSKNPTKPSPGTIWLTHKVSTCRGATNMPLTVSLNNMAVVQLHTEAHDVQKGDQQLNTIREVIMVNNGKSIFDNFEGSEEMGRNLRSQGVSQQKTAEALNEHYGVDVFKKYHVSKMDRRTKTAKNAKSGPDAIEEEVKRDRLEERLRAEVSTLKRKNKALMKQANLADVVLEYAKDSVKALPTVPRPKARRQDYQVVEEIANLLLSDLHGGENVDLEDMGGINEYNFEIMAGRLEYMSDSIQSIVTKMQGYSMPHLNVNALGDMVSGIIHEELVENAEGTVIEWLFNTAIIVSQFLTEMLTVFETIDFVGVVGNHGRMTKQVRFKKRYTNWDHLLYQIVALMMMNNDRIKFTLPKSFFYIREVGGRKQLLLHGDNIRSWAGIPWYGIQRAVYKITELLNAHDQHFDDVCLGHFHNEGILARVKGRIMLNGSVVGSNEYSVGALFASSEPRQLLYGVSPKRQDVTWEWSLNLADADVGVRYKMADAVSNVVAETVAEYL